MALKLLEDAIKVAGEERMSRYASVYNSGMIVVGVINYSLIGFGFNPQNGSYAWSCEPNKNL